MLSFFPLLAILWIAYNLLLLVSPNLPALLGETLFNVPLPSDAIWNVKVSDIFITIGLITLYIEVFKATRTSTVSVVDHSLSMLVFVAFLIEFLIVPGAGTSVFFLLMIMSLIDVIAGFTVSIVSARRDFGIGRVSE